MRNVFLAIIVAFIIVGCKTCPVTVVTKVKFITPEFVCPVPAEVALIPDAADDYIIAMDEKIKAGDPEQTYISFKGFMRIIELINTKKGDDIIKLKSANTQWRVVYYSCVQQAIQAYKQLETSDVQK